jgi:L-cysteine S-thiosulfotransferase
MGAAAALVLALAVVGDGIPEPLTTTPGDAARGQAIVADRQQGLCLLCHTGPFAQPQLHGTLASDLRGAGSRWSEAQLRLRVADSKRLNPDSLMPSLHKPPADDRGARVGAAWRGKPVLDAQQVEDVVAYLKTLR